MIVSDISNTRVTVFTQNQTPKINRVEHTTRRGQFMTNSSRVFDVVFSDSLIIHKENTKKINV